MIEKIEVALPSLEEQRCIVAYLDGLQAKVDALLPSVLDKAFKGEL